MTHIETATKPLAWRDISSVNVVLFNWSVKIKHKLSSKSPPPPPPPPLLFISPSLHLQPPASFIVNPIVLSPSLNHPSHTNAGEPYPGSILHWNVYLSVSEGANSTICELAAKVWTGRQIKAWDFENKQRDNNRDSFPFIVVTSRPVSELWYYSWSKLLRNSSGSRIACYSSDCTTFCEERLDHRIIFDGSRVFYQVIECDQYSVLRSSSLSVNDEVWRDNGFPSAASPYALPIWDYFCRWQQQYEMGDVDRPNASSACASSTSRYIRCWWLGVHPGADDLNPWKVIDLFWLFTFCHSSSVMIILWAKHHSNTNCCLCCPLGQPRHLKGHPMHSLQQSWGVKQHVPMSPICNESRLKDKLGLVTLRPRIFGENVWRSVTKRVWAQMMTHLQDKFCFPLFSFLTDDLKTFLPRQAGEASCQPTPTIVPVEVGWSWKLISFDVA